MALTTCSLRHLEFPQPSHKFQQAVTCPLGLSCFLSSHDVRSQRLCTCHCPRFLTGHGTLASLRAAVPASMLTLWWSPRARWSIANTSRSHPVITAVSSQETTSFPALVKHGLHPLPPQWHYCKIQPVVPIVLQIFMQLNPKVAEF